jgi:hypothetical protein
MKAGIRRSSDPRRLIEKMLARKGALEDLLALPETSEPKEKEATRLAASAVPAVALAIASEAYGITFTDRLTQRMGVIAAGLLVVAFFLLAISLDRKRRERSIQEQMRRQLEEDDDEEEDRTIAIARPEREPRREPGTFRWLPELGLWATVLFSALGLLLVLRADVVAGVIAFVFAIPLLAIWASRRIGSKAGRKGGRR